MTLGTLQIWTLAHKLPYSYKMNFKIQLLQKEVTTYVCKLCLIWMVPAEDT
jgi:hypothetical protein